jgi:hypothetical protein
MMLPAIARQTRIRTRFSRGFFWWKFVYKIIDDGISRPGNGKPYRRYGWKKGCYFLIAIPHNAPATPIAAIHPSGDLVGSGAAGACAAEGVQLAFSDARLSRALAKPGYGSE